MTDHTIAKELVALRAALKLAKRRGIWKGDPAEVLDDAVVQVAGDLSPLHLGRVERVLQEKFTLLQALTEALA